MKFVIATQNPGKVVEIRDILRREDLELVSLAELGITDDPVEDGETFEANALIKARAACIATGLPAFADDSGLEVKALGGRPGIHSARYGGFKGDFPKKMAMLLQEPELLASPDRSACFTAAVACVFPDGREFTVRGECPGILAYEPRGNGGFGYDPLFLLPDLNKTFAEIPEEEKNSRSHRAAALKEFSKRLDEYLPLEKGK